MAGVSDHVNSIGNAIATGIQAGLNVLSFGDNAYLGIGNSARYKLLHNGTYFSLGPGSGLWYNFPFPGSPGEGANVVYEENHFTPAGWISGQWTASGDAGGALALQNDVSGVLKITTDGDDGDHYQIRQANNIWQLASGYEFAFETIVKFSEATDSLYIVGLAASVADVPSVVATLDDGVFFYKPDTETGVDIIVRKDDTTSTGDNIHTAVANTWVRLGFRYNGTSITPYVNGVAQTAITTNVPDDLVLALHFAAQTGANAVEDLCVDWYAIGMQYQAS